jgi:hypothetical protein
MNWDIRKLHGFRFLETLLPAIGSEGDVYLQTYGFIHLLGSLLMSAPIPVGFSCLPGDDKDPLSLSLT